MTRFDYLSDKASNFYLMNLIKEYWRKRGHQVKTWVEKAADPQGSGTIWVVRSDIVQDTNNIERGYTIG